MQKSSQLSTLDPENRDTQKEILEEQPPETTDTDTEAAAEEEEEEEEEFSFFCEGANTSPIAAEDVFFNGQIKPIYPLFNQDLLLEEREFDSDFPINPQVKKVFVEMNKDTSPFSENDVTSKKPEGCKKSNSTGFSKIWRFKDFLHRSNSDGRDAFVFLNNNHETTSSSHQVVDKVKVKKGGKKKEEGVSAHEVYLKNKAKENDRRKSYLPYRPEVFGFFTNVNGGMSKNVHPF